MPAVIARAADLSEARTLARQAVLVAASDALVEGVRQLGGDASPAFEGVDAA